jgi:ferredoxin
MRIGIIGSGLSAWAVFESIKERITPEDSITIIDGNKRYSNRNTQLGANGLKTKFGSAHVYDVTGSGLQIQEQSNFSLAHGGLSNTWGAGIRLWGKEHLESVPIKTQAIYEAAIALLEKIPYSGDNYALNFPTSFDIHSNQSPRGSNSFAELFFKKANDGVRPVTKTGLAVSVVGQNACRGCGSCLSGCPYGSIFETGTRFDKSLRNGEFEFIEGLVWELKKSATGTSIFYKSPRKTIESIEFDKVYLCAGAIGTPAILMRSKLLPSQVKVADSQVFYFMGISYFKKNKQNEYFALSQATITSGINEDSEFMCSLYSCNSDVRSRISDLIASRLFGLKIKPPKFLDRFLFLGIGFIDSTQSGTIQLDLVQNSSEIQVTSSRNLNSKKVVKKVLKKIAQRTRKAKMYTFTGFFQMPNPGAGFHSGASMPAGGTYVTDKGNLRSLESVVIADVSILPFIKPGPHTFTSMAINTVMVRENLK